MVVVNLLWFSRCHIIITFALFIASNPNVLVELGYAANIIGWENIILVVNTDYGDAGSMPFDIAHHRLATYSFGTTYDLIGTDDEISKYNAICELSYMITELEVWGHYLDTFEGMVFLPLAVINNSSVADEDITVSIEIDREKAEIILPTRDLFNTEIDGLQGKIYEMDIMKKYLMMTQTSDIQYDADISYSVEDIILEQKRLGSSAGINGTPMFDEEDYEMELSKYIATPMEGAISEYVFKIKSLHALEKKWLGGAILLKPIADSFEITYSVKSHSSDGNLSGVLTYYKE